MKSSATLQHTSQVGVRDSNIELYRILSMLLIIAHHYVVNSGLTASNGVIYSNILSLRSQFLLFWGAFGKIGINCFVLITGYFMCRSNISLKKYVKLLFELMFYRVIINTIFWVTGYVPFTFKALFYTLLPIQSIAQNFGGTYLMFFLCIPFLNVLVHNMNELQHLRLVLLCFFIYILMGSLPIFDVTMNYVSWFIVLYFIASYIRLYPKKIYEKTVFWGIAAGSCILLCLMSVTVCSWLYTKINKNVVYYFVADSNKFLAVLTGLSTFLFFKNIKIKPNKLINTISSTTFGILLIHAHSDAMRRWLWKDICNNVGVYHAAWMPLHAVGCVVAIFAICSLIDLLRIRFIEKPFFVFWDKHYPEWLQKFKTMEAKLLNKLKIGELE